MPTRGNALNMFATIVQRDGFKDSYQAAIEKSSFNGQYTASSIVVTLSIALALYNCLEMVLLISMTFKRWRGLYFWCLVLCNAGVAAYTIGMTLTYFHLCILWFGKTFLDIGWVAMILFQSLVLYSRLGLIVQSINVLKAVKWMIVVDSLILFPLVIVLDFGSTYGQSPSFAAGYFYVEHIQITGFTIQELIISGIYVWKTVALLKVLSKPHTRNMIWQLLTINIIIVGMDILIIVLQYKHLQLYQESIKAFVYSVKLKLELNVLSKLVDLVGNQRQQSMTLNMFETNATIQGQALSDGTRGMSGPGPLDGWLASDGKDLEKQTHNYASNSVVASSSSQPSNVPDEDEAKDEEDDEIDKITRTLSQQSRARVRDGRRESDVLYADFIRSMS